MPPAKQTAKLGGQNDNCLFFQVRNGIDKAFGLLFGMHANIGVIQSVGNQAVDLVCCQFCLGLLKNQEGDVLGLVGVQINGKHSLERIDDHTHANQEHDQTGEERGPKQGKADDCHDETNQETLEQEFEIGRNGGDVSNGNGFVVGTEGDQCKNGVGGFEFDKVLLMLDLAFQIKGKKRGHKLNASHKNSPSLSMSAMGSK